MSQKNPSPSKNFFIIILLLIIAGFIYYNFSPTLKDYFAKKPTSTSTPPVISETIKPNLKDENYTSEEVVDIGDMKFPVIGTVDHPATGFLRLLPARGGSSIQYENLNFKKDTGLYVYLSKDLGAKSFQDLGPVKATSGTVTYAIPDDINPSEYTYILTWSKKLNTLFNYVELPVNPI